MSITPELHRITEDHATLTLAEASALMRRLLAGQASDIELAALLGALAARGETAAEIAGFALAMREAATPLPLTPAEQAELVDTCGTGGDGSGTFNISTAAALVAAAAGAKVAKHGNRAVTSRCGSADVLEALGIPTQLAPAAAAQALRTHGFCFLLAPAHHPAMHAVMPVRRILGVRTVFNVLGPLLNPAGARRQVMGVYSARLLQPMAEAMAMLGVTHAFVVHGHGGLDELSLSGPTEIAAVFTRGGTTTHSTFEVGPAEMQLDIAPLAQLSGGDAQANARILSAIFAGEHGAHRDVVVLNAAAVLVVAGLATDLLEGSKRAQHAFDTGAVMKLVTALRT